MSVELSFSPDHEVKLQLDEVRLAGQHALQRLPRYREFKFKVLKAFVPFTRSAVLLASCSAISPSPVVIKKIYDPRYYTPGERTRGIHKTPRPWTVAAEAAVGPNPAPLSCNASYVDIPQELYEAESIFSTDDRLYRAGRRELYFQRCTREGFEGEREAYRRLTDLQGSDIPRLLGVG